jgi:valyl-tRNA synthetase
MDITQQVIVTIRSLRKDLGIPEKEAAPVKLSARTGEIAFLADSDDYLPRLARVSSIDYGPIPDPGPTIRSTEHFDVAVLYQRQIDIPAERERLTKDLAKFNKGIEAAEKQLNNPGFLSKAPADKVEGLRKQYAETLALQQKAEAALAALPLE